MSNKKVKKRKLKPGLLGYQNVSGCPVKLSSNGVLVLNNNQTFKPKSK